MAGGFGALSDRLAVEVLVDDVRTATADSSAAASRPPAVPPRAAAPRAVPFWVPIDRITRRAEVSSTGPRRASTRLTFFICTLSAAYRPWLDLSRYISTANFNTYCA